MLESIYQGRLIKKLKIEFPGCVVIKNDSEYQQGFPDLTMLYWEQWAVLEVKGSENAPYQPNQEYFIEMLNRMSFAAFIYPENEREVLRELQRKFEMGRQSRFP